MDPSPSPTVRPSSLPPARRRELARAARDAFPPMGIYAIRIPASGALRVLASRNVPAAINRTRFELQRGASRDRMLQQAWNAGGEAAVRFETLELVRERDEAAFDYAAELQVLLELWTAELAGSAP